MPSKSPAQARLMAAAAHDPEFARQAGVPVSVAREFNQADAGGGLIRQALRSRKDIKMPKRKGGRGKRGR